MMLAPCPDIAARPGPPPLLPDHRCRSASDRSPPGLAELLGDRVAVRRQLRRKQTLFHAGQPCHSLFLIHAGSFKTCVVSREGREKVTGFHLRGGLLGCDAYGTAAYTCDAVALDTSEVWELPIAQVQAGGPDALSHLTGLLAGEIRRDWRWMLLLSTLDAEQRVAVFLLDLADRMEALGFSPHRVLLRMTRAELGNFLALQLETVTRVLARLASRGLIHVEGRAVSIDDAAGLHAVFARQATIVSGH